MSSEEHASKRMKTSRSAKVRKLMAANDSFVSLEEKLPASTKIGNLRQKFEEATDRLLAEYEAEMSNLDQEASVFLHNLDDRKHDEETVRAVIEACPNALSWVDEVNDDIPVQKLLSYSPHGFSFIPLLATEGRRLKVFAEDQKGGLDFGGLQYAMPGFLKSRPDEYRERLPHESDADYQAYVTDTNTIHDRKATATLRQLFDLKLFERDDVIAGEMIYSSAAKEYSKRRFEFVTNLCPEGLVAKDEEGDLPIQYSAREDNKGSFGRLLKAGLMYYPRQLGFLLHKYPGTEIRTIEMVMKNIDMDLCHNDLFKLIHDAIPPSDDRPILHDVIRLAPKCFSLFWKYYPNAIYLRDIKGRLTLHIALQRAAKWSPPMLSLIAINDPIDRHEKDPESGLFSFMSAASGRGTNLDLIYFLLRRDPNAWEGFRKST